MISKTSLVTKQVFVSEKQLTLTFNKDEIHQLLLLGKTSHNSRKKLLDQLDDYGKHSDDCATLLGDMYFAAAKFVREETDTNQ